MPRISKQASDAEIAATGKRWCSVCQRAKPIEGGVKSSRMWRCKTCLEARKQQMQKARTQ